MDQHEIKSLPPALTLPRPSEFREIPDPTGMDVQSVEVATESSLPPEHRPSPLQVKVMEAPTAPDEDIDKPDADEPDAEPDIVVEPAVEEDVIGNNLVENQEEALVPNIIDPVAIAELSSDAKIRKEPEEAPRVRIPTIKFVTAETLSWSQHMASKMKRDKHGYVHNRMSLPTSLRSADFAYQPEARNVWNSGSCVANLRAYIMSWGNPKKLRLAIAACYKRGFLMNPHLYMPLLHDNSLIGESALRRLLCETTHDLCMVYVTLFIHDLLTTTEPSSEDISLPLLEDQPLVGHQSTPKCDTPWAQSVMRGPFLWYNSSTLAQLSRDTAVLMLVPRMDTQEISLLGYERDSRRKYYEMEPLIGAGLGLCVLEAVRIGPFADKLMSMSQFRSISPMLRMDFLSSIGFLRACPGFIIPSSTIPQLVASRYTDGNVVKKELEQLIEYWASYLSATTDDMRKVYSSALYAVGLPMPPEGMEPCTPEQAVVKCINHISTLERYKTLLSLPKLDNVQDVMLQMHGSRSMTYDILADLKVRYSQEHAHGTPGFVSESYTRDMIRREIPNLLTNE